MSERWQIELIWRQDKNRQGFWLFVFVRVWMDLVAWMLICSTEQVLSTAMVDLRHQYVSWQVNDDLIYGTSQLAVPLARSGIVSSKVTSQLSHISIDPRPTHNFPDVNFRFSSIHLEICWQLSYSCIIYLMCDDIVTLLITISVQCAYLHFDVCVVFSCNNTSCD